MRRQTMTEQLRKPANDTNPPRTRRRYPEKSKIRKLQQLWRSGWNMIENNNYN